MTGVELSMPMKCLLAVCLLLPPWQNQASNAKGEKEKEGPDQVVVVTATRSEQPLLEAAALVTVVGRKQLERQPALTLDEHLRRIPGFSLFRRSNSLSSHPTTQGVSLRGVGPSGASRSLVLFDGLPVNDPFGGWVYWNRYPLALLERVEVVRGAGSPLYGSASMGGTIQLLSRKPQAPTLELRGVAGNPWTFDLEGLAASGQGNWQYLVAARAFETDGFYVTDKELRGSVDRPVGNEFQSFFGRLHYKDAFIGLNLYRDRKNNGTPVQVNHSSIAMLDAGFSGKDWNFRFYTQSNRLESKFSRIFPGRDQEVQTSYQRFPSHGLGSTFTWDVGGNFQLGADWRLASWDGNRQNLGGVFAQDLIALHPRLDWLLGMRVDLWQNRATQVVVNPRSGFLFRAAESLTLRSSWYRGFRAPTLNELYRPFRVGNILTSANPDLLEENLWGWEVGGDFHPSPSVLLRLNGFWNWLQDPVSNVTLSVTPDLILRQRQNQGEARVRGVESEVVLKRGRWNLTVAYLYSNAVLTETGFHLPQVPSHQAVAEIVYAGPMIIVADARWIDRQFDDDRNELPLKGYLVVNAAIRKPLSDHLEVFVNVENLLDRDYPVAATPIERLGEPRLLQAGFRMRFGD